MPKAFSVASWNVEHFKNAPSRVGDVIALLASLDPDVFALYEVEGKDVFGELVARMPGYQFHITEGPQVQEILVGVRSGFTAFFTQKIEFKSGNSAMRPGALLTLTVAGQSYPILFLHLSSGPDPRGWGLRDDMLERALEFRRTLQASAAPGKPSSRARKEMKESCDPFSTATRQAFCTSSYWSGITPRTEANRILTELNAM